MFVVGFYQVLEEPNVQQIFNSEEEIEVRTNLKIYFCCTTFGKLGPRIRELYQRHRNEMIMFKPQAISLISGEINGERAILERMNVFPVNTSFIYIPKNKSFNLGLTTSEIPKINEIYDKIVHDVRHERLQGYQMRMDALITSEECQINDKIIRRLNHADDTFFGSSMPFCQNYIDCYVNEITSGYQYQSSSRTLTQRPDIGRERLTDSMYALKKINLLIDDDSGSREIDEMVNNGVISKKDLKSLRKVAEVENVDTSGMEFPDDSLIL